MDNTYIFVVTGKSATFATLRIYLKNKKLLYIINEQVLGI